MIRMSSLAILLKIASRITGLNRSLSLEDRSWRSAPLALFLSKCIRLLLFSFQRTDGLSAYQNILKAQYALME